MNGLLTPVDIIDLPEEMLSNRFLPDALRALEYVHAQLYGPGPVKITYRTYSTSRGFSLYCAASSAFRTTCDDPEGWKFRGTYYGYHPVTGSHVSYHYGSRQSLWIGSLDSGRPVQQEMAWGLERAARERDVRARTCTLCEQVHPNRYFKPGDL